MKLDRMIAFVIICCLFISGISILVQSYSSDNSLKSFGSSYSAPDSIRIEVRTLKEEGIKDVANGTIDVFLEPISSESHDSLSSEVKNRTGEWKSDGGYDDIYFNPAHNVSPYECKVWDELEFNPFSIQKVRYAANFLINRSKVVDEFYEGHGEPRYLPFSQSSPAYDDHYEKMVEENRFTPEGDKNKGKEMIKQAFYSAMNDTSLKGELKPPDNSSKYWRYKPPSGDFDNIEVKGVIRIEDQREKIGDYFSDLLEECGIKVIREKPDRSSYDAKVWSSDPSELDWHFYTGGWSLNPAQYFQDLLLAQTYAGWYGYMPGGFIDYADYRYGYYEDGSTWDAEGEHGEFYGDRTLEKISERLYQGKVNSEKQYWDYMEKATELGINESVRVFICSNHECMLYNKSEIKSASTNVITGWDDIFTPRTIHTYVENLTMAQYSPDGDLYRFNWNELDGSYDTNGLREKRMLMDPGTTLHPETGKNIPIRCNWYEEEDWYRKEEPTSTVEKAYEWKTNETGELVLEKNISVPEDAVIYDPENDTWKEVGSGVRSAVKVTYKVVGGKWHSGADLTLRDVMGWHAWSWDMSFKDGPDDDHYHKGFAFQNEDRFNTIKGERWDKKNQTYTIWGDYTFPIDSKIGSYYSIWPAVPYYQYEAVQFLVSQNDTYIPYGTGTYSWDQDKEHWVNWISEEQGEDIVDTLQNMIEKDYIPWYLKEENNAPITVSKGELEGEIQSVIDFYSDHHHVFVSNGPYMADEVGIDKDGEYLDFVEFTEEDGYPFFKHYYRKMMIGRDVELKIVSMEAPYHVDQEDLLETYVECEIHETFQNETIRDLTPYDNATARVTLHDRYGNMVHSVTPELEDSTFHASLDVTGFSGGTYTLRFTASIPGMDGNVTETISVIIYGLNRDISVDDFEIDPEELVVGETATINAVVENTIDVPTKFDIRVDSTPIRSYELEAGESIEIEEEYMFDSTGSYTITIGEESKDVEVLEKIIIEDVDLSDDEIRKDEKVEISAKITNNDDVSHGVDISVDGETYKTLEIEPGTETYKHKIILDEKGAYEIKVGDRSAGEVDVKGEEPGFSLMLFSVTLITAFVIYWRRDR